MLFLATSNRPALAEDREWIPYKKFIESFYLDKFYSAPANQRDKLKLLVKVAPVNKAIPVSNEKTAVAVTFAAKPPENLRFNYLTLMGSVKQWNDLINDYAGLLRFVAPKLNGIELHFAKPAQQTLQVVTMDGVKTFTADAEGSLKLKLDETWMKDDPQIVLSEHPVEIEVSDL